MAPNEYENTHSADKSDFSTLCALGEQSCCDIALSLRQTGMIMHRIGSDTIVHLVRTERN